MRHRPDARWTLARTIPHAAIAHGLFTPSRVPFTCADPLPGHVAPRSMEHAMNARSVERGTSQRTVAVVTESFLPTLNGVTTSVLAVLDHLERRGHRAVVIAPDTPGLARFRSRTQLERYRSFDVHRIPAVAYRQFPVALPHPVLDTILAASGADVLHAASPFLLGGRAITAAGRLGIPSVAVFQTDVAGFARRNGLTATVPLVRKDPRAHPRRRVADARAVERHRGDARRGRRAPRRALGARRRHRALPPGAPHVVGTCARCGGGSPRAARPSSGTWAGWHRRRRSSGSRSSAASRASGSWSQEADPPGRPWSVGSGTWT